MDVNTISRILLVEDDVDFSSLLQRELSRIGMKVTQIFMGIDAIRSASTNQFDLIILDLKLPDVKDGNLLEVFYRLKSDCPEIPIIIITSHGRVHLAVEAIKKGAYDFLEKPFDFDRLMIPVRNALEKVQIRKERDSYHSQLAKDVQLIGNSGAIKDILSEVSQCAATKSPVLILGKTGVGKELVARAIHMASGREGNNFVAMNVTSITDSLFESELFGHKEHSFTGAKARLGKIRTAAGGTLFLDEIGDMSLDAQAKVLRVLEDGVVTPVGNDTGAEVDFRLISATNQDLLKMVDEGSFRKDLFYRINTVVIEVPPLSHRVDDIALLANHFLNHNINSEGLAYKEFTPGALSKLRAYEWPGNVRELSSIVKRSYMANKGESIEASDVEKALDQTTTTQSQEESLTLKEYRNICQREFVVSKLKKLDWNITEAAKELGITRPYLYDLMKELDIPLKTSPDVMYS